MKRVDNIRELRNNNIFVFDKFISKRLCTNLLLSIDDNLWTNSLVVCPDKESGYLEHLSPIRTSKSLYENLFTDRVKELVADVESKINVNTHLKFATKEGWQLTKYGYEEKFEFHLDCVVREDDPAGQRDKTIMLYLMSPEQGGETFFRALNLYVSPLQGRLVVWDNLLPNGNCNYAMMHAGLPVKKGLKVILHTWTRKIITLNKHSNESTRKSHQRHH